MSIRRIPVRAGPRIIDMCDEALVEERYANAPNAELVRKRKTGQVMEVILRELSRMGHQIKRRQAGQQQP